MTELTPAQYAELVPLQRSIAETIRTTRVMWGAVDDLASAIAVAVAVYMGPQVAPVEGEMTALREQVEQARRCAVALEQENAELTKQVESVRAFAVSHEYRWLMELLDDVGTHGGHL